MKMIRFGIAFKWLGVILIIGLVFLGSLKAWELAINKVIVSKEWHVTTMVYHRFGDERYPSTNTSINDFEQQLKWLKQNGYTSLNASEVMQIPNTDKGKYVCITIDDGYKSFKENGLPVLKKYGMKSTLFVNTESVGWGDYLTWDEIKELEQDGVEIGNHSHGHAYFVNIPEQDRLLYFESDLRLSEKLFSRYLGHRPVIYAYPYGEFSSDMAGLLKTKGYKLAFAQNSGVWNETSNRWAIPRFPMAGNVNFKQFQSKMKMLPLRVNQENDYPVLILNNEALQLTLKYDQMVYPGPMNCFVNGDNYELNRADNGLIKLNHKFSFTRRRNLVTITTKDVHGDCRCFSHLYIKPQIKE